MDNVIQPLNNRGLVISKSMMGPKEIMSFFLSTLKERRTLEVNCFVIPLSSKVEWTAKTFP